MSIIKHVTLQKIVAHDFRYDPLIILSRFRLNISQDIPYKIKLNNFLRFHRGPALGSLQNQFTSVKHFTHFFIVNQYKNKNENDFFLSRSNKLKIALFARLIARDQIFFTFDSTYPTILIQKFVPYREKRLKIPH